MVVEEIVGLSAWEVCRCLAGLSHLIFFDSAQQSEIGQFSYVSADPFAWVWPPSKFVNSVPVVLPPADPFDCLAESLERFQTEALPGLPPFQGGAAGLFAYDLCHYQERLPRPRYCDFPVPDMAVGLYDWVVSFDHHKNQAWLISTGFPEMSSSRRDRRAQQRRDRVKRLLRQVPDLPLLSPTDPIRIESPQFPVTGRPGLFSNFDEASYLRTLRRAIDYINAGDCFQVNIAQRLLWQAREHPLATYERLRQRNAAPFAGYIDLGHCVVASASPERFLQVQGGMVETRPIKGTAPRGRTSEEDDSLAENLANSAKDRAENVMIVDLLRNDLGRVCEFGSIHVDALCRLESYRFVHHLVSEVRGKLKQSLGPIDLMRAAFPGGSVTGAPKIRAMEIITELEQTARGAYCGSLGFIGFDGSMDSNLLIRTFTIGQGWVQFPVGGGIVADSDPQREYEETWHKAEGMLRALH